MAVVSVVSATRDAGSCSASQKMVVRLTCATWISVGLPSIRSPMASTRASTLAEPSLAPRHAAEVLVERLALVE